MWIKSESNVSPVLQDTESSRVYNYDRRNVEQTEKTKCLRASGRITSH